jgi:RHS repeat-associated protein
MIAGFVFSLALLQASVANAQSIAQGYAGIVPGSNDYTHQVAYANPADACASFQNSFVPRFGYEVFGLISVTQYPDQVDYNTQATVTAYGCFMDAGPNNNANTIISLKGCTDPATKLTGGSCIPNSYPVTGEPLGDCPACKGTAVQFPSAGDPVSVSSGAKTEVVTDYSSGGPYPIEIKRYYRSLMMPDGTMASTEEPIPAGIGLGWRLNLLGRRIDKVNNQHVLITRENGEQSRFVDFSGTGAWQAVSVAEFLQNGSPAVGFQTDAKDKFAAVSGVGYVYTDETDRKDVFAVCLRSSQWKGGYTRSYSYASGDVTCSYPLQISDSLGRVINLTWNGGLLSEVDLPDGTRLSYTYQALTDANGQSIPRSEVLTQVSRYKADGTLIDTSSYQYDRTKPTTTAPLLTGVIDAKGVQVETTTYDNAGRVLTAQGASGADAISVSYDDANNTRTVTNALGQVDVYTMRGGTSAGASVPLLFKMISVARQASSTVPAGTYSQASDGAGFLATKTDWNGKVTNYTNDATGNETQRVEDVGGLARTYNTTWSTAFREPTQIVGPNLTVDFTYDASGNLLTRKETDTSVRSGPTRTWTYTWNSLGQLLTVSGPRTDVVQTTTYTYDVSGNLATVKDALNHVTTINAVNAAGLPTTVTDPNNVVTNLTYDPLGRLLTTTAQGPTPATTAFTYDADGLLSTVTSAAGVVLTYGYDDARRLTSITDSAGNKMVFALDGLGNRTQTQIQTGSAQVLMTNSATFDSIGRLLTSIGAANQTTQYQYDPNGNLTKLIDPRNAATQTAFDGLNRVKQVTDALNGVTQIALNLQDNVTSVTDAKLHATAYTLNAFGFVSQVVSPDTGTTTYTTDLAGNITSSKDPRKVVTNYTYDALNRPLTRTYPASTTENVTYGYDSTASGNYGVGRLTSLTDQAGTAAFTYDAYGNRIADKRTIGTVVYNTGYGYDLAGSLTKITYPSGMIVNYQRDSLGQVSGVTMQANATANPVTLASSISYRPFGAMQAGTLGNGAALLNDYDLDYRLARIRATGSSALQDLTLGYDSASNISSISDALNAGYNQTLQYDLDGHVTQGVGPYGTDNYTYDLLGNRLTRSLVNGTTTATTYTYTTTNTQLLKAVTGSTTLNYAYDANGSRLTLKNGNTTQASYTYNNDARLATAGSASMKYNAFGERLVETITGGGTHFIFGQNRLLLAEHTTTGALVRNYVYLNGKPLALVDATGTINFVLNDQVGQPQKMLNASGAVTWQRVAGIFGDTVSQPIGSTSANPQRFPGQQYDANTGLHYNYFRDYDPTTGRYIEADPIGLRGGTNPYAYAANNPVDAVDPGGLACVTSGGTVHCSFPGGGPSVNFPAPEGWPASINANSPNYHAYDKQVDVGNRNPDCIRRQIAAKPTPGHPSPATPGGTFNDATPSTAANLIDGLDYISSFGNDSGGYANSPVYSYLTKDVKTGGQVIVNVTLPGHPLFPGYVARTVGQNGSDTVVHNYGEGTAALQNPWNPLSGPIDNVWEGQTRDLAGGCGCQR